MEGMNLDKSRKEVGVLREKLQKSDRNLKYVKDLIESYKKDRQKLQTKLEQAKEEIASMEKRLAEEKLDEVNNFKQLKKAEVALMITNRRLGELKEISETVAMEMKDVHLKTDEEMCTNDMEGELLSNIKCYNEKFKSFVNN